MGRQVVHKAIRDSKVYKDCRVISVFKEMLDYKACAEIKANREMRDGKVSKVFKELMEVRVFKGARAWTASKVHKDTKGM